MKKIYRLKKEKDFKQLFYAKRSKANKQCIIYYLERKNQPYLRTGISVSKKLGNAVVRNRIKRKIRRAIYELRELFCENYDIIVIARQPMVEMSVHDIKKSLLHVLHLCHLIKNKHKVEED
ncbi:MULTISPECIES: ribonuclease P protein component [unclassified Granulicatella]|uniref:ribonuclease P protein component n=1 Tax=unclassified Granulicatella TaxID=2630493 RepID=UPI0010739DDC|nr:ribonuclease P protein component [Granulicatella sp. WM01]MBF0781011.1 ribonuclease P protein component [Granulicatella sp. 19428wC4_WM01]TFU92583.1 ribonuclease P protein component [Granulicatella sp. WM01]